MTTVAERATKQMSGRQWAVVGLLVASVAINFVDRSNLSLAVPLMQVPVMQRQSALTPIEAAAFGG